MRIPLFRIWYSTTYTALLLLLLLILAITPADTIYQSIRSHELQKLFVIGGVYFLTFLIVLLIYSTRIYTNRTVLAAIPKPYIPVEEGEVGKGVRRMVAKQLKRSAIVAWDSRPRDLTRGEEGGDGVDTSRPNTAESKKDTDREKSLKRKKSEHHGTETIILPVSADNPPWGHVSHPGWASPSSADLPSLQYWSVICELPNLIEAKAVSLAPLDSAIEDIGLQYPDNAPPLPDAQIVTLLQRPRTMGLRDYLSRLAEFGLLNPSTLGAAFLAQYEHARFSTASLTEPEFRAIMSIFADILNGMTELDQAIIDEARAKSMTADTRSLAPTESSSGMSSSSSSHSRSPYRTPLFEHQRSASSYSESLLSTSDEGTPSPRTARTAPSHRSPGRFDMPRTPSQRSAQSETGSVLIHEASRRSPSTLLPSSETLSLRSARSVIRLHPNPSEGNLPYQYQINGG
ncbi:sucrase/ferredoxin domain-containing protein [Setomelanomma holmii]|uniref:Defect at low temperature protein 1 n=1 Tax=Setomelanomma holmii TaxID=210430 RepID=A0A9P4LQW2_9PLEO|nr:sucrase/ferredoxin domain-containing protein [Setomelanomma holmii]